MFDVRLFDAGSGCWLFELGPPSPISYLLSPISRRRRSLELLRGRGKLREIVALDDVAVDAQGSGFEAETGETESQQTRSDQWVSERVTELGSRAQSAQAR